MATYIKHEPTDLERKLAAEREAADEAAEAAVKAEYRRFMDAREAKIRADDQRERSFKMAADPNKLAAEGLRAALDDSAWSTFLTHLRVSDPARLKAALLFIAGTEASAIQHAEHMAGIHRRAEAKAKKQADAQAVLEARAAEIAA